MELPISADDPNFMEIAYQLLDLKNLGYDLDDPDTVSKARVLAEVSQRTKERLMAPVPPPLRSVGPGVPVVYYIQIRDTIKIGWTTQTPEARRAQLAGDRVLAIEPGGKELEAARHRQFAGLRVLDIPRAHERFYPEPVLLDHIAAIREEHAAMQIVA